jgi:hypothetical protein
MWWRVRRGGKEEVDRGKELGSKRARVRTGTVPMAGTRRTKTTVTRTR